MFVDALRLNSSGKLDRSRLSSVRGAKIYAQRTAVVDRLAEIWTGRYAIAQPISSFLSEAAMDKLLADVDAMFSAIADSTYKRQLTKLES